MEHGAEPQASAKVKDMYGLWLVLNHSICNGDLHLKIRSGHHCCQMLHGNTTRRISLSKFRCQNFVSRKLITELGVGEHIFNGEVETVESKSTRIPGLWLVMVSGLM